MTYKEQIDWNIGVLAWERDYKMDELKWHWEQNCWASIGANAYSFHALALKHFYPLKQKWEKYNMEMWDNLVMKFVIIVTLIID